MSFQIGTMLLDSCVLAVLSREDTYGYILTQNIKEIMDISESTLYPVLRRLQSDGCLTAYDQPFQGRNRRYYQITAPGKEKLGGYLLDWRDFKCRVDQILSGGDQFEK